jgi:hypothetical protein
MKIGSLKEAFLSHAKNVFLFDSQVAGLDAQTLNAYHDVLTSFVYFTGNILVKDLTPDHVRLYINNLSDGPSEGEEHTQTVIGHYAVIHEWIRWLYAQKFVTERIPGDFKSHLTDLFPVPSSKKILTYCA